MSPVLQSLPILILYPHSRCNCRCIMCDIWKATDARELTAVELERHLASVETLGVKWVVLSGGEPLMHSDLFRLCSILRARKIRTTLLSTGLLIERLSEKIVEYVDDVIVSLDGPRDVHDRIRRVPGAFDRLADGVRSLRVLNPLYPIGARCTIQKLNCTSLCDTVEAARTLGLKSVSFLAADVSSTAFNRPLGWTSDKKAEISLTVDDIECLEAQIERLIGNGECGSFISESPDKLLRLTQHFRAAAGLCEPIAPRCNAPWVSAVVEAGGSVRPCFFQPPIGNLQEIPSLFDILNGPAAVFFRASLNVADNPICRRCVCSLDYRPARDEWA